MNGWLAGLLILTAYLAGVFTRQQINEARIIWREYQAKQSVYRRLQAEMERIDRETP